MYTQPQVTFVYNYTNHVTFIIIVSVDSGWTLKKIVVVTAVLAVFMALLWPGMQYLSSGNLKTSDTSFVKSECHFCVQQSETVTCSEVA